MMISRLILSLRKAAASQGERVWSLEATNLATSVRFAGTRGFGVSGNEIGLDTFGGGAKRSGTGSDTVAGD